MANAQRIASGFPFPIYVNETATKQRIAQGVYVDEKIAAVATGGGPLIAGSSLEKGALTRGGRLVGT